MASESGKRQTPLSSERARLIRELPPVDECLHAARNDSLLSALGRDYLKRLARRAEDNLRDTILSGSLVGETNRGQMLAAIVEHMRMLAGADGPTLKPVVNATGVVLHTNLGRALLAEAAIEAAATAARSAVNLEYDLESGARGERDHLVEDELLQLTGAEAAAVVNNNAAAVLLALNTLAEGRDVIISRGELIEIGGSFRLPDVMECSGARLKEVGTTNRTHPFDYADAINHDTALLLKVHPSNYQIAGFTASVSLAELVEIGRARGIEVMEDLGAGALVDMTRYGLPPEPMVRERVAAGAGLVTFSADKLIGGPQAGIIVGHRSLIERLRANPLRRALRCDKLTLAALEATLRIYLRDDPAEAIPTLRILRRGELEIEQMARQVCAILRERLSREFQLEVVETTSAVGSGSLPAAQLKSRAIRVSHQTMAPEAVAARFRQANPPIIGRISNGALLLDLRMVEDPAALAAAFEPQRQTDACVSIERGVRRR